jgi:3-hydroxyisobutyrate dehydrogenase-like beta-hydroxyacid dehydrogenase
MGEEIGFVGLGNMGGPMANRLIDAGHRLAVYDIRDEAMAPLVARGAARMNSSHVVADASDIVFFSLPEPKDVEGEALGPAGVATGQRAKIFVDLSTTGPRTTARVVAGLTEHGIAIVDAPVSGGVAGAKKGTLAVMASGPQALIERVRPLLAIFGKVFHVGERPGMGQAMKLCNNVLSATSMAVTAEAMVMGVKAGLDPALMLEVINSGTGRNTATETKFPNEVITRRFTEGFYTGLMYKDVRLCLEEAEALQVPMWVGSAVRMMWQLANNELGPQSDFTEIVRLVEDWAGVEVKAGN